MKTRYFGLLIIFLILSLTACRNNIDSKITEKENVIEDNNNSYVSGESQKLTIITDGSVIRWSGENFLGKADNHFGTIDISSGEFLIKDGHLTSGDIVFDMTSILDMDLQSVGERNNLEDILKSEDFFNIEKYPETSFSFDSAEFIENQDYNYLLTGKLNIKDVSREIVLQSIVNIDKNLLDAKINFEIDRAEFGLKELPIDSSENKIRFEMRIVAQDDYLVQ